MRYRLLGQVTRSELGSGVPRRSTKPFATSHCSHIGGLDQTRDHIGQFLRVDWLGHVRVACGECLFSIARTRIQSVEPLETDNADCFLVARFR